MLNWLPLLLSIVSKPVGKGEEKKKQKTPNILQYTARSHLSHVTVVISYMS